MRFADNLKQIRIDSNLSQKEFSNLLEIDIRTLSNWEQDLSRPNVKKLLFVSEKLNISLDDLVGTKFATPK